MATAICAWLRERGVRVAPFKAQNMSNNSYPCLGGGEIGRAQVAQAWACGLEPEPAMNPILLKPNSATGSQVVVHGKVWKTLPARGYYQHVDWLRHQVLDAYEDLAARFEVIVIEGAGSVAELNLRPVDLVNFGLATRVGAASLLVSDIERGGVFGSLIGTVSLLEPDERALLRAFAVNKFRGDRSLFDEGRDILEQRTGLPCLGVFPFADGLHVDDEDSLSLPATQQAQPAPDVAIIRFPRISNTTDFRLLRNASWLDAPVSQHFRAVILPGTKNTIDDLAWMRAQGLDAWVCTQARQGAIVLGICGGMQMLGEWIADPLAMESHQREAEGLGLLPLRTTLAPQKTVRCVQARTPGGSLFAGYEIHLGQTQLTQPRPSPFATLDTGEAEGLRHGNVMGTYLHGATESPAVLLEILGIHAPHASSREEDFRALSAWFHQHAPRFGELFLDN
jgi:adenosylcobyric acid synthase